MQRYANKINGEERAVIFLRLAAVGFSIAAIGGTTIAAIVFEGYSVPGRSCPIYRYPNKKSPEGLKLRKHC